MTFLPLVFSIHGVPPVVPNRTAYLRVVFLFGQPVAIIHSSLNKSVETEFSETQPLWVGSAGFGLEFGDRTTEIARLHPWVRLGSG